MKLEEAKVKLSRLEGQLQAIDNEIESKTVRIDELEELITDTSKARIVITDALAKTQMVVKERIDTLVTLAIQSVFDRPFEFEIVFENKRNNVQCRPIVKENGNEYAPKDDMGGGIIDIISFAFRVVLWSLEKPKTRNVFILDEPMKFVGKGELLNRAGEMLSELSRRLNFQLIVVTHEPGLSDIAEQSYSVKRVNGISKVESA